MIFIIVILIIIIAIVIFFYLKRKKGEGYSDSNDTQENLIQDKINFFAELTMDIDTCINKANQNDITALFELGYRYYNGMDVMTDMNKAVYYTRQSAELDSSDRSNGKLFYFALFYNLGEKYGLDMRFAEKCLMSVANENYDAKYYVSKIIRDSVLEKKTYNINGRTSF